MQDLDICYWLNTHFIISAKKPAKKPATKKPVDEKITADDTQTTEVRVTVYCTYVYRSF